MQVSTKHALVDKANRRVIVMTSVAAFVVMFSLVASQALFGQMLYQNRVVNAKKETLKQLKTNQEAVNSLESSYKAFVSSSPNVIGGAAVGTGPQDGDNAKLILDALPSKYDFPALATSLEKLLNAKDASIDNIAGIDDEVAQSAVAGSGSPVPVAIPFQLGASGSYDAVKNTSLTLEASIRPIQLLTMSISGDGSNLSLSINAQTYYQPAKQFSIGKKVVE